MEERYSQYTFNYIDYNALPYYGSYYERALYGIIILL